MFTLLSSSVVIATKRLIGWFLRFHFMWEFLGLSWQDIKLLSQEEAAAGKARL